MSKTSIEWAQETWNPLAGCKEISPGCTNCYAAVMAHRLAAMGQEKYKGTTKKAASGKVTWTGKINFDPSALMIPLKRKKPTTWFVNSMSDLFHADVPDEYIDKVFAVMALCPQHTFQVLTKRAERLPRYFQSLQAAADDHAPRTVSKQFSAANVINIRMFARDSRPGGVFGQAISPSTPWPLPNVWIGVSVEDQSRADERIPHLLQTPAAVRFLSCEPLLGPLVLIKHWYTTHNWHNWLTGQTGIGRTEDSAQLHNHPETGKKIDWVICGAESGHGARSMEEQWARDLKDQCVAAGVEFFLKQFATPKGKKIPLPMLDGQTWEEMPTNKSTGPKPSSSRAACTRSRKNSSR